MSVPVPAAAEAVMFPNGARFHTSPPGDKDVFLGGVLLKELHVTFDAAPTGTVAITVYNGLVASTQRVVVGGSTTPAETYKVQAGTSPVAVLQTENGQPYVAEAPSTEVTNLRQEVGPLSMSPTAVGESVATMCLDVDLQVGAAIHIDNDSGVAIDVVATYEPYVSGWTRRRRNYQDGSVTRVTPPATTGSIPL